MSKENQQLNKATLLPSLVLYLPGIDSASKDGFAW
jgi:hypothetical protein